MPKGEGQGRIRRVLIASYGNVLVPELIKLLDPKRFCLFVLFNDFNEIGCIQKALGKKRLVPILTGNSDKVKDQGHGIPDDLIRSLPDMDAVINVDNSSSVSKFYEKRKRFKTTEIKFQKASAAELKCIIDSTNEPCLLNLLPETTIGLTHMFDHEGLDIPIRTHISTSFQNSFRKLFQKKNRDYLDDPKPTTSSDGMPLVKTPTQGRSNPPQSQGQDSSDLSENSDPKVKTKRTLSLLKKKKEPLVGTRSEPQLVSAAASSDLEYFQNQIRHKENSSYKKSLNKLHHKYFQTQAKNMKKLELGKVKDQNSAEKVIEEEMRLEKGRLESKVNDLNSTTLARSEALTPDTANKIIASREARVNKEVFRNANKKKVVEFEKIEETFQEKVNQSKSKLNETVLKIQQEAIDKIRKKYEERLVKKSVHRSQTIA